MEAASARSFKSICVFCGTHTGKYGEFVTAAHKLGRILAERKIQLVYGGGSLGLMGCVSSEAYVAGGGVLGIIPSALAGIAGKTLGIELEVSSVFERMGRMLDHSDAFIALPGGLGTLEEIFQIVSWSQLNIHHKPIGLLNVKGFYDGLLSFLDHAVEQHFITPSARRSIISASKPEELLDLLQAYVPEPDPAVALIDWSKRQKRKSSLDLSL